MAETGQLIVGHVPTEKPKTSLLRQAGEGIVNPARAPTTIRNAYGSYFTLSALRHLRALASKPAFMQTVRGQSDSSLCVHQK